MTTRTDTSGTSTYDAADRLKTITNGSTTAVLTASYNTLSQPSQISYGTNANYRVFGYDHLHRLTGDTLKTSAGSTIASITYGYDLNNNETSKTTTGFAGSTSNAYTYDWANRLLTWNNGANTANYAYGAMLETCGWVWEGRTFPRSPSEGIKQAHAPTRVGKVRPCSP
jgi:hypothetical protein